MTKRVTLISIAVAFWFVFFHATAFAATYYVDFSSGADTNNGISTSTPFQHSPGDTNATNVAASTTLTGGDTVIFKGGVQYTNSITLSWSGSAGSPITYDGNSAGTFGTGKAIIGGGYNNQTYGFYMPSGKSYLTFNNFEFTQLGGLPEASYSSYNCTFSLLPNNPGYGLYLVDSTYVTITNNYFHGIGYWQNEVPVNFSGVGLLGTGIYVFGADHLTISNNEFTEMEKPIRISPGQFGALKSATNVTISNNNFHNMIRWVIELSTSGSPATIQDISVFGNTIHDIMEYTQGNWVGCNASTGFPHVDGVILGVSNLTNETYGSPTHPIRIYNNQFYQNTANIGGGGITAMIFLTTMGGTVYIYNNTFVNSSPNYNGGYGSIYVQDGPNTGSTQIDYGIYNNSFYDPDFGVYLRTVTADQNVGNGVVRIKNNIFQIPGSSNYPLTVWDAQSLPTEVDYNIYKTGRGDNAVIDWLGASNTYTVAAAEVSNNVLTTTSSHIEANGLQTDPLFVDVTHSGINSSLNNLHLTASSPARGAGANLSSIFTTDAAGTTRPSSGAWDIGAYQYSASSNGNVIIGGGALILGLALLF